jgi:hypothetical protein
MKLIQKTGDYKNRYLLRKSNFLFRGIGMEGGADVILTLGFEFGEELKSSDPLFAQRDKARRSPDDIVLREYIKEKQFC